jgi:hypothetical protein
VNFIPIAGIVALPTTTFIAERYFFIPAVGLWLIAADALERLRRRIGHDAMLAAGVAVVVLALGARTSCETVTGATTSGSQDPPWRSSRGPRVHATTWGSRSTSAAMRPAPGWRGGDAPSRSGNALALVGLGVVAARTGDPAGAERYLVEAVRAKPTLAEAHLQLGKLYDARGDAQRAASLHERIGSPWRHQQDRDCALRGVATRPV